VKSKIKANKNFIKYFMIAIFIVFCLLLFVKDFKEGFWNGYNKFYYLYQKPTVDKEKIEDSCFVFSFIYTNTNSLKNYCKNHNYIPEVFINSFKLSVNKTYNNAVEYMSNNLTKAGIKNIILTLNNNNNKYLEEDFLSINKRYSHFTRKDYCQMFDEQKEIIIQEKIKLLKAEKPQMFLD